MSDELLFPKKGEVELPFKPFRLDEILAITGVSFKVYDHWLSMRVADAPLLPQQTGDDADKTVGLNYMQTFAVFVGFRFLHEGAPNGRAEAMVRAVQHMTVPYLERSFEKDLTFYDVNTGVMVRAPNKPLGQRLNLRTLYREFLHNLHKVFPEG